MVKCLKYIGLFGFMVTQTVFAEPVINESKQYYEFDAGSREEIWHRISRAGGRVQASDGTDHGVRVAWTSHDLQLKYQFQPGLNKCRLTSYQPILNVTVTLPYWRNKWEANPVLADNWDNYVRMVANHESVHKDHAIKMAKDLDQRLGEIGVMKSCRDLKAEVKKIRDQVISENVANNRWFDAKERVYQKKLKWF